MAANEETIKKVVFRADGDVLLEFTTEVVGSVAKPISVPIPDSAAVVTTTQTQPTAATTSPEMQTAQSSQPARTVKKVLALVSSSHLTHSSKVFRSMLSRVFTEGQILCNQGVVAIPLPEDEFEDWEPLLHLIHANLSQLPLRLNPKRLMGVASLVDKYDMQGLTGPLLGSWLAILNSPTAKNALPTNLQNAGVAFIFSVPDAFEEYTKNAIIYSTGANVKISTRIPDPVLKGIARQRHHYLKLFFDFVNEKTTALTKSSETKRVCPSGLHGCDSIALGSVQIMLTSIALQAPVNGEFHGLSLDNVSTKMKDFNVPGFSHTGSTGTKCQRLDFVLRQKIAEIVGLVRGLKLDDFKSK